MRTVHRRILAWLADEEGQDLIEYAMLAFFVAVALVGALSLLAEPLSTLYSHIASAVGP